ncbi:ankyrin repeat domain-containing protein, partial [Brachyspira hyodysenteriae]|uniref:ankyrin repeat domain-containing protein n=1 Tax=Brachyspira hyodysenteriae TaxID=159 RepID=UPI001F4DB910
LPDDFADYPYINKVEGDSFNIGGSTPLMFAIFKNNSRIVKQLIDKNADVKARDNEGTPVFLYACGFGNGNIIRMLLVKDVPNIRLESRVITFSDEVLNLQLESYYNENKDLVLN